MDMLKYAKNGDKDNVLFRIENRNDVDTTVFGMITNNEIPGIAPASASQMDSVIEMRYDVTGKVSVKDLFSMTVRKERFLRVMTGIVDSVLAAEEYMVGENTIVQDLAYIYADPTTCSVSMICLPIVGEVNKCSLVEFFKGVLITTEYEHPERCSFVAVLLNYLTHSETFSLQEFRTLLVNSGKQEFSMPERGAAIPSEESKPAVWTQNREHYSVQQFVEMPREQIQEKPREQMIPQITVPKTVPAIPLAENNVEAAAPKESEQMSMLYLLRHYSKENAELYKAQRAKGSQSNQKVQKEKGQNVSAAKKNYDFAVPTGDRIPGFLPANDNNAYGFTVPNEAKAIKLENNPSGQKNAIHPIIQGVNPDAIRQMDENFGNTVILTEPEEMKTVLLTNQAPAEVIPTAYLVRSKNGERIFITKSNFRIGAKADYVDYCVTDNPVVSRSHVRFVVKDGEFFVVDMNSTNGTKVNGGKIAGDEEVHVDHDTVITLGNEEFVFKKY